MAGTSSRKAKYKRIILAYPLALVTIAFAVNLFGFGVEPVAVALPSGPVVSALIVSALLLLANHTLLMTSTELTRLRFDMHATPEEWAASGHARSHVSDQGWQELERRRNAHTNATENTVLYALLAGLMAIVTPVSLAAVVWITAFALGRLGHALSYLSGRDDARGLFMSLSLIALYGMASYLAVALVL